MLELNPPFLCFLKRSLRTLSLYLTGSILVSGADTNGWPYSAINLPDPASLPELTAPITIAIVDDGIRHTHEDLQGYLWRNPNEIPFNHKDDDKNGLVDDLSGWDVADGDSEFTPPNSRVNDFYHGTHLASVIVQLIERVLGSQAGDSIQLIPVKAISDYATREHLTAGYAGVEYAANLGADIILCAWSQGTISAGDAQILQRAAASGSLIIAAAGNFAEERETFPAAHPDVLSIAALNQNDHRLHDSTYGTFVDLAAPGEAIPGAHSASNHARKTQSGTSPAAALVAGTAALIKRFNPSFTSGEIAIALKSSTTALNIDSPLTHGRLGSGKLNVKEAISAQFLLQNTLRNTVIERPKGYLRYARPDTEPVVWTFQLSGISGNHKGTYFKLETLNNRPGNGLLSFVSASSGREAATRHQTFKLAEFVQEYFVPGPPPTVLYYPGPNEKQLEWVIRYQTEPIHLPSRYCQGTTSLTSQGQINDGSGPNPYSPQSDCLWQINAPEGQWIEFEFKTLEIEKDVDKLYIFAGTKTNTQPFAIVTGNSIPMPFTLPYHQALIWFVTDAEREYEGWSLSYRFVEADTKPDDFTKPPPTIHKRDKH